MLHVAHHHHSPQPPLVRSKPPSPSCRPPIACTHRLLRVTLPAIPSRAACLPASDACILPHSPPKMVALRFTLLVALLLTTLVTAPYEAVANKLIWRCDADRRMCTSQGRRCQQCVDGCAMAAENSYGSMSASTKLWATLCVDTKQVLAAMKARKASGLA